MRMVLARDMYLQDGQHADTHGHDTSQESNKAEAVKSQEEVHHVHSPRISEKSLLGGDTEAVTPASQKPADHTDDMLRKQGTVLAASPSPRQLAGQRSPEHDDDEILPAARRAGHMPNRTADIAVISDAILAGIFTELAQDLAKQGVYQHSSHMIEQLGHMYVYVPHLSRRLCAICLLGYPEVLLV
jgi:hypothetical protein